MEQIKNPVLPGFNADPSIIRVDDTYYIANSTFEWFPGVRLHESKDMVHWKLLPSALSTTTLLDMKGNPSSGGIWAPDLSYADGKFWLVYTDVKVTEGPFKDMVNYITTAEDIHGPWSDPIRVNGVGFDASLFHDDDGRKYLVQQTWDHREYHHAFDGITLTEFDTDTMQLKPETARNIYNGTEVKLVEGPHLYKINGYYYLFEAEGGTGPGHRITVSRSRELKGIYEPCPYNPIMRQNNPDEIIQRCGHGKPVQTQNGQWYMVYLCGRKIGDGYSILGRETALDPITWTADGWPIVNNLNGPSALQVKPELPETIWESESDDDFNGIDLSKEWWFSRVPEPDGINLADSHVYVKGSLYDLDSMKARNILLRRQKHFKFSAICKMNMPELYPGQNCGMTCYYDENTYIKFGIFATLEEQPRLMLNIVEKIGKEVITHEGIQVDNSNPYIYLKCDTNYLRRTFSYSYDEKDYRKAAVLDNVYYLCDEGYKKGKRFTGAMIGMYAFAGTYGSEYTDADGRHGTDEYYAMFDYFKYIE